jgi:hypothetical protein
MMDEISQHDAVEIVDDGAFGHVDDQIISACTVLFLSLTVHAVLGPPMRMILECQKRRDVSICHEPNIAATTAIATVRSTLGDVCLTAEGDAASAAIASSNIQLAFIDEP